MWAQIINTLLGIWLMAASGVLGYGEENPAAARTNDQIIGPIIATFACCAIWQVTRAWRWINLPLGLWLIAAPWLLAYPGDARVNSMIIGALVAALSCVRGKAPTRMGGGWSAIWRKPPSPRIAG